MSSGLCRTESEKSDESGESGDFGQLQGWGGGGAARRPLSDVQGPEKSPGSALNLLLVPLLTVYVSSSGAWCLRARRAVRGTGLVAAVVLGFPNGRTVPLGRLGASQSDRSQTPSNAVALHVHQDPHPLSAAGTVRRVFVAPPERKQRCAVP